MGGGLKCSALIGRKLFTPLLSGRINVIDVDCIESETGEMRDATKCVAREQRIVQAYLRVKMRTCWQVWRVE